MDVSLGILLPVVSAIVGVTSWNVKLQGRVNGHDAIIKEHDKQATERHADVKDRLVRIESKMDRMFFHKNV